MKIDVGNNQWVDLDKANTILPKEPETNSVKGSFDFKPETVITMDNGDVIKTPTPISELMQKHRQAKATAEDRQRLVQTPGTGADDVVKAMDDGIKELMVIRKEFQALREIINRFCIVAEEEFKRR